MTVWQVAGTWFGLMAYAVAWVRGGRPERIGAAVLLLDSLVSAVLYRWHIGHIYPNAIVKEAICLLFIGWLAFRSDRWWPSVTAAALCLVILTYSLRLADPTLTHFAAVSAHVGLNYLIDLTLLFGVLERWLAGERPAGAAAWARAARATAASRDRRRERRRENVPH